MSEKMTRLEKILIKARNTSLIEDFEIIAIIGAVEQAAQPSNQTEFSHNYGTVGWEALQKLNKE